MSKLRMAGVIGTACVLVFGSSTVFAQTATTGAIAGIVRDATGAVLPGVTVEAASPALIEQVRSVVTDGQGRYNIVDLRPGTYSVTFTLAGFGVVKREGIILTTGFTAPVNAELRVGAVEETLTVTGASPVVDVQRVSTQNVLTREVLDTIPSGRTISAYAALTVGAVTTATLVDVGGDQGERYGHLTIHSSRTSAANGDGKLTFDGLSYNILVNNGAGGNRQYFVNQAAVQEVNLELGGMSAETEGSGVAANFIPKDGGNRFSIYGNVGGTNGDLQGNNINDELRARGANAATAIRKIWDFGVGVGGPLKRDRLWFYTAHRSWGTQQFPPNTWFDKDPHPYRYEPDLDRPGFEDLNQRDHSVRLTWQPAAKHKLTFFNSYQDSCFCNVGVQARAPEGSINYFYEPIDLVQGTWTWTPTNRLLIQVGASHLHNQSNPRPLPGTSPDAISITELTTLYTFGSPPGSPFPFNVAGTEHYYGQHNERFSLSYVTGSHALKVGGTTHQGVASFGTLEVNQSVSYGFRFGVPFNLTQWATPNSSVQKMGMNLGLYAQDQWTVGRATLNLGVRYDHLNSYVPAQHRPASRWAPGYDIARIDNIPNFHDITPRLGMSYDLFGDGRTAIKAYLGKFVNAKGVQYAQAANPANAGSGWFASRSWTDDGNFVPDCDLFSPAESGECGPLSDQKFGTQTTTLRFDPSILEGWGVRENTWQFTASIQHELAPRFGVSVGYFRTSYGNFTVIDNRAVTPADYDPYCITTPTDSRLGDFSGVRQCGLYDLNPAKFGRVDQVVVAAENFGKPREVFDGVDFTFNWRYGTGGLLQGGVSTGRTVADWCFVVDSPQQSRDGFCRDSPPWSSGTQVKLAATYPLPWDLQASANFQNMPGFARDTSGLEGTEGTTLLVTNAQAAPDLGRNLSAGSAVVEIVPSGVLYEPRFTQLDLRLTKIMRWGRSRVQANVDLYNVTNSPAALNMVTRYGPQWLRPNRVLGARVLRIGAQVDW